MSVRLAPTLCVFDGQSLNILPSTGAIGLPYQSIQGKTATACVPGDIVAIGGTAWTTLAESQVQRSFRHANAAPTTVLVMTGGTKDVFNNELGAAIYATVKSYAVAARAAGYNKIVVTTTTQNAGNFGAMETHRKDLNNLLIGNADAAFDQVVDLASDSTLSSPGAPPSGTTVYGSGNLSNASNTTYYADGVHWTAAGAADAGISVSIGLTRIGVT